jgi:putative glutamine amidotransferase
MGRRPRIAINCDYDPGGPGAVKRRKATLYMPYAESVMEAGGLPLLVPPSPAEVLKEYLSLADGILFTGGDDYPPSYYGQKARPEVGEMPLARAESDRALMRLALRSPKPALGICAGLQLLNIAKGGALVQHLKTGLRHKAFHEEKDADHDAAVRPGSLLHRVFGEYSIRVNSAHHQAADPAKVAPGLRVSALAPDGTIEGLELSKPGRRFFLFVQWHPERMADAAHRRKIFGAFVAACRS